MKHANLLVALGGTGLYALALALPVCDLGSLGTGRPLRGLDVFRMTLEFARWDIAAGRLSSPSILVVYSAWLANPAIWAAIFAAMCRRWGCAAIFAGCGLGLCLLAFGLPGAGYWTWCGSAAFLLVASATLKLRTWHRFFARHDLPPSTAYGSATAHPS